MLVCLAVFLVSSWCPVTASVVMHHFAPCHHSLRSSHLGDHGTYSLFIFFSLCRTCKYPEGQSADLEKIWWNMSATVAFVGFCPKCPQVASLTSSCLESQGSVSHLSQSAEASCEFMENPRSWVNCLIVFPLGFNFVASLGA